MSLAVALCVFFGATKLVYVLASDLTPNSATVYVQDLILDAKGETGIASITGGDLEINVDLEVPNQSGGVILGAGASEVLDYSSPLAGASTRLIAGGGDRVNLNLLRINSAETAIRDMSLFGMTKAQLDANAERAETGVLVTKDGTAGLATGGTLFDNMYVAGFKTGVQLGVGVTENNCERVAFNKVRFQYNDAGIKLMSQQSMGVGVSNCEWYNCLSCIQVNGGGKVVVNNAFVHFPDDGNDHYFLRFEPRDYQLSIGPNSGMYSITGLYADAIAPDLKLISMRPLDDNDVRVPYYCTTTFSDFHLSLADYISPAIEVAGWSNTTFQNGWGLKENFVSWDNEETGPSKFVSRVYIHNCMIWGIADGVEVASETTSQGDCHLIVKDCYDEQGNAITDYDGVITGDGH